MVDRPGDPWDEGNSTGVFRRAGSGGEPDEFEQLFRGRAPHESAAAQGGTRKLPSVDDEPRPSRARSRTYDGTGSKRPAPPGRPPPPPAPRGGAVVGGAV
jgi:hypothetical protein